MEELNDFFKQLNLNNSVLLRYVDILDQFNTDVVIDAGDGKYIQRVRLTDRYIILKFFMPRGTTFATNHHDCKEETSIVYGEIKNTDAKRTYFGFDKMNIPKEVKHTLIALQDTLAYSKLFNPEDEK